MDLFSKGLQNLLTFNLIKRVRIVGNKWLNIAYILLNIIVWIGIIVWVVYNGGHLKVYDHFESTVGFSVKEAILTNYSDEDFNAIYVKPKEFEN